MRRALRDKEEQFSDLFGRINEAGFILDHTGDILLTNRAAAELLGRPEDELASMEIGDFDEATDSDRLEDLVERGESSFESVYRTAGGEEVSVAVRSTPINYQGETAALWIVRDISEHKERERVLERSLALYRDLFDGMQDAVFVYQPDGEMIFVNDAAEERYGYPDEELLSMEPFDLAAEGYVQEYGRRIEEAMEEGEATFEVEHETADGEWIPEEVNLSRIPLSDGPAVLAISRDVTRRKEAQESERFLHSLLRHDLSNKLQIVLGYLELLEEDGEDLLEKAEGTTESALDMIDKIQLLAEVGRGVEPVGVKKAVGAAVERNAGLASNRGVEISNEASPCTVRGGSLLEELFSNLIENAVKHSGGDEVRISNSRSDDRCVVTVEDDGEGIPEEFHGKVMEKGFMRGEQAGSGLGLYLVGEIAESYGAEVEVGDSRLGGARFDVSLDTGQ